MIRQKCANRKWRRTRQTWRKYGPRNKRSKAEDYKVRPSLFLSYWGLINQEWNGVESSYLAFRWSITRVTRDTISGSRSQRSRSYKATARSVHDWWTDVLNIKHQGHDVNIPYTRRMDYAVSQKTGFLLLIWELHQFTTILLVIFGRERLYSVLNLLR